MALINEEIKKVTRERTCMTLLLLLAVFNSAAMIVLYKEFPDFFPAEINRFEAAGYFFITISAMVSILSTVIINYYLLSKEYINDTWDLILSRRPNQIKLSIDKYFAFLIILEVVSIISFCVFLLVSKTFMALQIEMKLAVNFLKCLLFMNIFTVSCQFCFQLRFKNIGVVSIFAAILIFITTFIGQYDYFKYIPIEFFRVIVLNNLINNSLIVNIYCLINVLAGILLVMLFGRKFYKL